MVEREKELDKANEAVGSYSVVAATVYHLLHYLPFIRTSMGKYYVFLLIFRDDTCLTLTMLGRSSTDFLEKKIEARQKIEVIYSLCASGVCCVL